MDARPEMGLAEPPSPAPAALRSPVRSPRCPAGAPERCQPCCQHPFSPPPSVLLSVARDRKASGVCGDFPLESAWSCAALSFPGLERGKAGATTPGALARAQWLLAISSARQQELWVSQALPAPWGHLGALLSFLQHPFS